MTDDERMHLPEHGDDDLSISSIVTVVLSGALILLVVVLGLRAFVHSTMAQQREVKVVAPKAHALQDHEIEQRVLLNEYALNADGKSGRIPIDEAMKLVVEDYAASRGRTGLSSESMPAAEVPESAVPPAEPPSPSNEGSE